MTYTAWWVPFLAGWFAHRLASVRREMNEYLSTPLVPEAPRFRIVAPPPYDWADE